MKKIITSVFLFLAASNILFAQFTPGNVVVLQAGDGSTSLASTGNAIILKEFATTGGAPTYSLAIPTTTATGAPLVVSGSATSEGMLSRSADGRFLVFSGYANLYASSLASASATVAPRGVGYADASGIYTRAVISSSFYTGNNIRSAASDGNNNFWGAGASQGTNYFGTVSTPTLIQGSVTNSRSVNIFNNQLYLSTGSGTHGIYSIGTGTPTSTATSTIVIATGSSSSPYQFFFNAANTVCYIADDNSISSGGGIQKWTYNGTAWTLAYTLGTGTGSTVGARGVVADFSGTNPVIYATTAESATNRLISIIDGGSTGTSTVTTLATATTSNTVFRGLAFSPICSAVAISSVTNVTPACSNSLGLNITTTGSAPLSYTWSGAGAFSSMSVKTPTVTSGAATGIYSVTVANGCGVATSTVNVTVNTAPTLTANTTNTVVCLGSQITLTGSGASTYTWSSGATDGVAFTPTTSSTYTVTGTDGNGCKNSSTISITVNSLPTISVNTATICVGSTATLTASGATSYTWSTTQTTSSINPSPAVNTNYTVTGTDVNGCMNASTSTVTVNNLPTISFTGKTTLCLLEVDTLTAHGATSYTWSPFNNFTSQTIGAPTTSGNVTFTLTGTDANGCTNNLTQLITVNNLPNISVNATHTIVCSGDVTNLTGVGASTYTWSNGVTDGINFTPSSTNTYTVTGTDLNNCVNTATINVTVNNLPSVMANTSTTSVCAGSQITLNGGGATTYTWSSGIVDNTSFTPTATSTYTVTGTDNNNCVNTATVSVTVNNLPSVVANTSTTSVCAGSQITLNGGGATTYTWSSGVIDNTAFAPTGTSTYTVTGTDNNNCVNTATVSVTVNNLPSVVANTSTTSVCAGSQITLNGGGATTYTWSSGVIDNIAFAPTGTSTYTVTGTDNNNCMNTATVSVIVNNLPSVSVNSPTICIGATATLTASGAISYTWNTTATTISISPSPTITTTYTVIGIDANNCSNNVISVVTVNSLPAVNISASSNTLCVGNTATLTASGATNYTWNTAATTISISVSPTVTTTYTLIGTDANNCTNKDTLSIIVSNCIATGINKLSGDANAQIILYPNPNNGNFVIETNSSEKQTICIFDLSGKMVLSQIIDNTSTIDAGNLSNGIYNVRISTNQTVINKKIIITK